MLCEDYILMDDILFKIRYVKEQQGKPSLVLCVPEKYISIILYQYHTPLLGHPCIMTMYHMVRKKCYFPTMLPLIKQFVASCYECQSMKEKQPTPKVYYPRIPLYTRLMARVSMYIKEMPKSILGYTCILVCVCEYTNWIKAIPLVDQKAGTIVLPGEIWVIFRSPRVTYYTSYTFGFHVNNSYLYSVKLQIKVL